MNAKIRSLSTILLTVCMLLSGMHFAAFAENEPVTPTDLPPLEEVTQAENGTGENEKTTDGETPADEQIIPGEPAGTEPTGEEKDEEEPEEETGEQLPELHFGPAGYRGTLKAGEEFKIALRPEYSQNILVTLVLAPKAGNTLDAGNVRMCLNGEKKNAVRIENEDPENKGITLQFGTYAAKGSEYILSIVSPADADFILTAVKRPEEAKDNDGNEEKADSGDETEKETDGEEKTEVETDDEDGEKPASEAGNEVTAAPEPDGEPEAATEEPEAVTEEPETITEEPEAPAAEPETGSEEETETKEPAENGEQTEAGAEAEKAAEPETAETPEEPKAEPVKNEPATPTDLAPAVENQGQPANGTAKAGTDKKETKEKKAEEDKETMPTAEELLALGYYGSQVAMTTGADIYESMEEGAEPAAHLEPGEELWLRPTGDEAWAEIYRAEGKDRVRYIHWDDVIINQKPEPEGEEEEEEPLPARNVEITSTITGMQFVPIGTEITMTAELVNFREDDICTFQWQYLDREAETYTDIDGANELTYRYQVTRENFYNTWRLVVLIANAG